MTGHFKSYLSFQEASLKRGRQVLVNIVVIPMYTRPTTRGQTTQTYQRREKDTISYHRSITESGGGS